MPPTPEHITHVDHRDDLPQLRARRWPFEDADGFEHWVAPSGQVFKVHPDRPAHVIERVARRGGQSPHYARLWMPRHDYAYLHRVIAELYLGRPDPSAVVIHLDGDVGNNGVDNIVIGTQAANVRRDRRAGPPWRPSHRGTAAEVELLQRLLLAGFSLLECTGLLQRDYTTLWAWSRRYNLRRPRRGGGPGRRASD